MQTVKPSSLRMLAALSLLFFTSSCAVAQSESCNLVKEGYGPRANVQLQTTTAVSGLETPWELLFLPGGEWLITERAGRLRVVRNGKLVEEPLLKTEVSASGEGGMLGMALHPDFRDNHLLYVYVTREKGGKVINQVLRYKAAENLKNLKFDRVIIDNIPAARFHNGGRMKFGPDGMLYVGTGDAREPNLAQDRDSLAGKILRVTPEGEAPADNPVSGNPMFVLGLRNVQAFDWFAPESDPNALIIADHGPTGELGRFGHDEVSIATKGSNLGWPTIWKCQSREGMITPQLVFQNATPPGGGYIYRGNGIPQLKGQFLIGTLRSTHLHLVKTQGSGVSAQVDDHAVALQDQGRLRTVTQGPDGSLYILTSNCDGRGRCANGKDKVLKVTSP